MQTKQKNTNQRPSRDSCYRCGYSNHSQDECFYKNEKCSFCEKVGHLIRVCKARQRSIEKQPTPTNKSTRTHQVEDDDTDDDDIYACSIAVQSMRGKESKNEYIVEIHINSKPCKFEVDNGAQQSLMINKPIRKSGRKRNPPG